MTAAVALCVRDLHVAYHSAAGHHRAVRGVSLEVRAGQTVALVGESGSGKTTTALALVGLLPPGARRRAASIKVGDLEIATASERALAAVRGAQVGLVPQDPGVSLNPVQRIGTQVAEAMRIHRRVSRAGAPAAAIAILGRSGLDNPEAIARRYPHELSGGQAQRVLIGIALACEPKLVIADEPTSALDVTVQRHVLDHLAQRTAESGAAMLLITHDLGIAVDRADRILVMKDGLIVEQGDAQEVLATPQHPYTRALVAAAPSLNSGRLTARPRPAAEPGRTREPPAPATSPLIEARDLVKVFVSRPGSGGRVKARRKERTALDAGAARPTGRDRPAALTVELPGRAEPVDQVRALDGVSFTVWPGQTTALVGASGSGKTTSARAILRLVDLTSGGVFVHGTEVTGVQGARLRELRRRVQLVYQNPYSSLDPHLSVQEIVEAPLRAFRLGSRPERQARVRQLIDEVMLPAAVLARSPAQLSGGQRQRVAIARALAPSPECIVLDEPVSALDVSVQDQILRLLVQVQADLQVSYLFISHDLAVVRQVADQVYVLDAGRVVESGPPGGLFADPTHPYTRLLVDAIPGRAAHAYL
jgi:peptide/nickel transport system ATP-binding protein